MRESRILDEHGNNMRIPLRVSQPMRLHARFDAAQTSKENKNHWAQTDGASPNASVSPRVRQVLRNRSRYEIANNSYLRGMIETKVNFTIGRGPRLQMLTADKQVNREIEDAWKRHCRLTGFCKKVRTLYRAKISDGESIAVKTTNRELEGKSPVTLDLRVYEADFLAEPNYHDLRDDRRIDGVKLDIHRNARSYHILWHHPGEGVTGFVDHLRRGRWLGKDKVFHLYREDRPGLRRGIPYITPALPLFALMRRYTLAAVSSSEWAAEAAAVMFSNATLQPQDIDEIAELESIPWARNSLLTLPVGWDMRQLKAEQPTTTFSEFFKQILNEAIRCLDMPFNIGAGNSADMNMASGRLDIRIMTKSIDIERQESEDDLTEPYFEEFLREFLAFKSGIAPSDIELSDYPHIFGYDGFDEDDPVKVADAVVAMHTAGLLPSEDYWMSKNKDPEEMRDKIASEIEWRKSVGLPIPGIATQEVTDDSSEAQETADV